MCMKGWAKSKPQLLRGGLGDGWWAGVAGSHNLDPSVVVPVDVVQVKIAEAVGGYPGPSFPANSGCCPFQRNPSSP